LIILGADYADFTD